MMQAFIPPLCLFSSAVVFGGMLHCNSQRRRTWLTPIFLLFSYYSLAGPDQFYFSFSLMSLWNLAVGLYVLHTVSLFHIERCPAPKPPLGLSRQQSWMWSATTTYRLWGNPRVFLPNHDEPEQIHEVKHFVTVRLFKLVLYSFVHTCIMPIINSHLVGEIKPTDVDSAQRMLIRPACRAIFFGQGFGSMPQFTSRALVLRAHTAVFWILESVIFLDGANAALALFFVCIVRFDDAQDWPPLFGSFTAANSVARFWNRFWHQLATRPYVNIGRTLARQILRLDTEKWLSGKLVVAAIVFALSGCNHAIVTWQGGLRDWHLEIWWFMINFCACVGERFVVRYISKHLQSLDRPETSWIKPAAGCVWLFAFFCWSVPK